VNSVPWFHFERGRRTPREDSFDLDSDSDESGLKLGAKMDVNLLPQLGSIESAGSYNKLMEGHVHPAFAHRIQPFLA
jgi:hypothetical protein